MTLVRNQGKERLSSRFKNRQQANPAPEEAVGDSEALEK
jgi:hypothetical protein